MKASFINAVVLTAGLGLCLAWQARAQEGTPLPVEIVERVAGNMAQALNDRHAEFEAQPELLEELAREELLPALDVYYSARLILGRAGRGASEEQLQGFSDAMSNLLISRYATGLLEYRDREQIEVMPARGELDERMTRVRTRVRMESGRFIPVDYVFRKTDEGWKAFDVIVEGISYVTTYRNQIMPQVQELGLDEVTARLNRGDMQLQN